LRGGAHAAILNGMPERLRLAVLIALAVALLAATPSGARDGASDDVRTSVTCAKGVSAQLRVRADGDERIRVELEVRRRRSAPETWRVVLVHERRVAWRGSVRKARSSSSFRVRRTWPDLDGPDAVTARAYGPGAVSCHVSATLAG
jgi:hypothetical protein